MLVGYTSDEQYEALAGVRVEFRRDGDHAATVESGPSGAVRADLSPGEYEAVLAAPGYAPERTTVEVGAGPHQFRLVADRLLGYVWPKWVRAGDTAEYFLHTPADTRLSLWRYGEQKEEVGVVTWHDEHGPHTCRQRTPDGDYADAGMGWNREGYDRNDPSTQTVTAPDRSGLYYFHMETKSGAFFGFPWVVAPAEPTADVAVVAATNTWNAYNSFGGRSNYVNATGLPDRPVVEPRRELDRFTSADTWAHPDEEYEPLSFRRPCPFNSVPRGTDPTDPIAGKEGSHTAPAEWRLLAWLERQGYGYDLYADRQLHDGIDLDAYDALVVHTHPEYWSRRAYQRVKTWVHERGGRLAYLGGNGLNAEVEYLDDERMVVNNSTEGVLDGGHPRDTTEPHESRFARRVESEGHLLGVVYTASGIKTAAPYEVREPDHWVFEGTGLRRGDTFGETSLQERNPGGASGHETDKLSEHAPDGTAVLAKGRNPDEGGAEMAYYEGADGGATFAAGSITWTASLLVDGDVATITRNVLDRFTG